MFSWLQKYSVKKEKNLSRHLELELELVMSEEQSKISCFKLEKKKGGVCFLGI